MTASPSLRLAGLCMAMFSATAAAVGLGELSLHSRMGQPLRAIVPVYAADSKLDASCFSLAPSTNDLPSLTHGQIRLFRIGKETRLIISGDKPISEPILAVRLLFACGASTQREYTLLPLPPLASQTIAEPNDNARIAISRQTISKTPRTELNNAPGANAENHVAPPPVEPRRKTARRFRPTRQTSPSHGDSAAKNPANVADRIVIDSVPSALASHSDNEVLAPKEALEERLLKMETTLHLLNTEMDKLDSALALNQEATAMREKLRSLQENPPAAGAISAAPLAPSKLDESKPKAFQGWLEMLIGILVGGSVSAGVAQLVSRRQANVDLRRFNPPTRMATPGKAKDGVPH